MGRSQRAEGRRASASTTPAARRDARYDGRSPGDGGAAAMSMAGRFDGTGGWRRRVAAGALAGIVGVALASGAAGAGAAERAKRSGAERAFAMAYTALVPSLNAASAAVLHAFV